MAPGKYPYKTEHLIFMQLLMFCYHNWFNTFASSLNRIPWNAENLAELVV